VLRDGLPTAPAARLIDSQAVRAACPPLPHTPGPEEALPEDATTVHPLVDRRGSA